MPPLLKSLSPSFLPSLLLPQRVSEFPCSYYDLTTDNLENGWGPHFMFAPFPDPNETVPEAIKRHQHFLALIMGLKPGMRGLDAGCGTGGPSRSIARFAGVHITGISINRLHVERATEKARREGSLNDGEREDGGGKGGVRYIEGDFMVGLADPLASLCSRLIPYIPYQLSSTSPSQITPSTSSTPPKPQSTPPPSAASTPKSPASLNPTAFSPSTNGS